MKIAEPDPPADPAPVESGGGRWRPRARRLLGFGAVAVAIAVIATQLAPALPRTRAVELALGGRDPKSVVDVELAWSKAGSPEAVRGSSWHFAPGTAPSSIATSVDLADGTYELDITLRRAEGESESVRRVITLADADRIRLPIR